MQTSIETTDRGILLVEDNPDDAALTLRAFRKSTVLDRVVVVRDGVEALDYLFATAPTQDGHAPRLMLLDLKLPRMAWSCFAGCAPTSVRGSCP